MQPSWQTRQLSEGCNSDSLWNRKQKLGRACTEGVAKFTAATCSPNAPAIAARVMPRFLSPIRTPI